MKSKLMEVYDKYYDETFNQVLLKVKDREKAKEVMGKLFKETAWEMLTMKDKTHEVSKTIFEKTKMRYGLV
jgi:hypothetical protein